MARISKYSTDSNVEPTDKVIGTDASGNKTKNYNVSDLKSFFDGSSSGANQLLFKYGDESLKGNFSTDTKYLTGASIFKFNTKSLTNSDITLLFNAVQTKISLNSFTLKIKNISNPEDVLIAKIKTVINNTTYFNVTLDVSERLGTGVLNSNDEYLISLNLVTSFTPPDNTVIASDTVVPEKTYGKNANAGTSSEYSRADHTHGTPDLPILSNYVPYTDADAPVDLGLNTITAQKFITNGGDNTEMVLGNGDLKKITTKTSELINDGEDTINPFISLNDIPVYTLSSINGSNQFSLNKDGVPVTTLDLTPYLDDTNLARLTSGTLDAGGILTVNRDDLSSFTIDLSTLLDNQTASEVPIVDAGSIITATDVEGALQENRTEINLKASDTDLQNHITDTSNPHTTSLEQARTVDNTVAGDIDINNNDLLNVKGLNFDGGQTLSWNTIDHTLDVPTGLGTTIQVGQETLVHVYNNTGGTIPNGSVVYPLGTSTNSHPNVGLAIANTHETIIGQTGIVTADIPNNSGGFVTIVGKVRELDTSGLSLGPVYLSPTVAGGLTSTKPVFPDYEILMGVVLVVDAVNGVIVTDIRDNPFDTFNGFHNGTFREHYKFLVTSDGATITGSLSPVDGHPDMTMIFSDGLQMLPTTPPATITLTAGTDINPQESFIYIPKTTKVLTSSTSGFPTTEHIKVARVFLQSPTAVQSYGTIVNQQYNDAVQDVNTNQGNLSILTERMRLEPAKYESGIDLTVTIDTAPTPDDVHISTTAGTVYQIDRHNFPIFDTATGSGIHVINHFTNPYSRITNVNQITQDALGNSLDNKSFSVVLLGIINQNGEAHHFMMNLPTGSYNFNSPEEAKNDPNKYTVYSISKELTGVAFLHSRLIFTYKNNSWVLYDQEDLRGFIPNSAAGGGIGGGTALNNFTELADTPNSYIGQANKAPIVGSGETALEFQDIVNSFNGRAGNVVPTTNDYTWAQINKTVSDLADITTKSHTVLSDVGTNTHAQIDSHIADTNNPHNVTKLQIGLGNVEDAAASTLYEPLFTKNTGFNKNFGVIANTVAEGDDSRISNGQTAYSWGDHSLQNYAKTNVNNNFTEAQTVNELIRSTGGNDGGFGGEAFFYADATGRTLATDEYLIPFLGTAVVSGQGGGGVGRSGMAAYIETATGDFSNIADQLPYGVMTLRKEGLSLIQLTAQNKNNGASLIGSRLQVGYDRHNADQLNMNTLDVNGNGKFSSTVEAFGGNSVNWNDAYTHSQLTVGNPHLVNKTDVGLGNVDNTSDLNKPISTATQTALDLKEDKANKDQINGYAGLDASGKINPNQLPALAVTDTFVVASEVAMLALTAETGDVAVRTDENKSYILQGTDPSLLSDWQELLSPTDSVSSVFGRTGIVTAQNNDYTWAQINKTTSSLADITTRNFSDLQNKPTTIAGYGISDYNSLWDARLGIKTTDNLAEGTLNKYYSSSLFDTDFSGKTTTDLAEGINLYYTDARVSANSSVAANTAKVSFPGFTSLLSDYNFTDNSTNWDAAYNRKVGDSFYIGNNIGYAGATSDFYNFVNGNTIFSSAAGILWRNFVNGSLIGDNATGSIGGNFLNGSEIFRNADAIDTNFINGYNILQNATSVSYNFVNGSHIGDGITGIANNNFIHGLWNLNGTTGVTSISSVISIGSEALRYSSASILNDAIALGWRAGMNNTYNSPVLIGKESQATAHNQVSIGGTFYSGGILLNNPTTVNGTITATGGNSTNWNTAYGWGNHATQGYYNSGNFVAGIDYQTPLNNVAFTNVNNNFSTDQTVNGTVTATATNTYSTGINIDTDNQTGNWSTHLTTQTILGIKPEDYTHIVNYGGTGTGQGTQIASSYGSYERFFIRRRSDNASAPNGANVWQPWHRIMTDVSPEVLRKGTVNTDYFNSGELISRNWDNQLPDALTGAYPYGLGLNFNNVIGRANLEIYAPEQNSGATGELYYRTGWGTTKRAWHKIITDTGNQTINGTVTATDFIGSSDRRLKENITDIESIKLPTKYKSFNFKDNSQKRIGLVAQDVEKYAPEFVRTDEKGYKSISYNDLHSAEIAYLKDKIEKLEKLIKKLL